MRISTCLIALSLALPGACPYAQQPAEEQPESTPAYQPGEVKPEVGDAFQKGVDEAWELAAAGEDPSNSCAAVKGRVQGTTKYGHPSDEELESARQALQACNLDIPVRYFHAMLDKVRAGELDCRAYFSQRTRSMSAMTVSVGDTEPAEGETTPEQALRAALRQPEEEACPDVAPFMHAMEDRSG